MTEGLPLDIPGYSFDPLRPDTNNVTPVEVVARLTASEREQRVRWLIEQAYEIVDWTWRVHGEKRQLAAACVLFSGGNDSTVLAHMFKDRVEYAVHCNTTIGIEATRQFVRDTCKAWNLALLEMFPPKTYRQLILDRKNGGFPGPAMHFKMYARLKERGLEALSRELVSNPRRERLLLIAGRRRSESQRRQKIGFSDRKGSRVFASPLAMWTKLDLNTYRLMMGDVPVNEVSELLHMSGECLCGSFAKENELEEIRQWFPDVAAEIDALMAEARRLGFSWPWDTWGHRQGAASEVGLLCSSCEYDSDELMLL